MTEQSLDDAEKGLSDAEEALGDVAEVWFALYGFMGEVWATDESGKFRWAVDAVRARVTELGAAVAKARESFAPCAQLFSDGWKDASYECHGGRGTSPFHALLEAGDLAWRQASFLLGLADMTAGTVGTSEPEKWVRTLWNDLLEAVPSRDVRVDAEILNKALVMNWRGVKAISPQTATIVATHKQLADRRTGRLRVPIRRILDVLSTLGGFQTWSEIGDEAAKQDKKQNKNERHRHGQLVRHSVLLQEVGVLRAGTKGTGVAITALGTAVRAHDMRLELPAAPADE